MSIQNDSTLSPAAAYRKALTFPAQFDVDRAEIEVCKDYRTGRFVVAAVPFQPGDGPQDAWLKYARAVSEMAQQLWLEKYGEAMPEDVECRHASTWRADAIPYTGTVQLAADEMEAVSRAADLGAFTLDVLWLMVEGLDWRPGRPVPGTDPGWLAIWAEDEKCGSYFEIVRSALGMPGPSYERGQREMPEAVRAAYSNTGGHHE